MAMYFGLGAQLTTIGAVLGLASGSAWAQFGAATGEIRLSASARYEAGGVPTADGDEASVPVAFGATPIFTGVNVSTPEANGGVSVTVQMEPSRLLATASSNANAWCDAPLESCGSIAENRMTLGFVLPHGGSYAISIAEGFVQTSLRAFVVIRDSGGVEVLRIEDEQVQGVTGDLAPGSYTIEAESVALGEGEIPPHLGGYAAWSLAFEVTPAPPPCPGDSDGDNLVTFGDVTIVLANFGAVGAISGPGDADGTGVVGFADVTSVLANIGAGCR